MPADKDEGSPAMKQAQVMQRDNTKLCQVTVIGLERAFKFLGIDRKLNNSDIKWLKEHFTDFIDLQAVEDALKFNNSQKGYENYQTDEEVTSN